MGIHFISVILFYILLGTLWSDFMQFMIKRTLIYNTWSTSKKIGIIITWPISFLAFLCGLTIQIIETIKRK